MKRRDFLSTAAAGLAGAALAGCGQAAEDSPAAPARIKTRRTLRMVTTWPKNFPGLGSSAERIAQRIAAASEDAIRVEVLAAGEFVPAFEAFDAVSSGAADLYNGAEYYWQGKSHGFNFFTSIPFGMTALEMAGWIYHGGGQALWDKLSARFNLKPFMSANTGVQMGGWFVRPVRSLRDLKGLSIRIPGLGGEIYRRLGAAPVTLPGGEIFPSMQSGKIKAAEWVGPWNDLAFGFHQLAPVCHWPGFHEPGAALATVFNLDVWNRFSPAEQAMIAHVCMAETIYTYAEFNHYNAQALEVLTDKHKIRFLPFPPDVMSAFRRVSREVVEETSGSDPLVGEIYANYMAEFRKTARWLPLAEQGYLDARHDPRRE